MLISEIVEHELEQRAQLRAKVMSIVFEHCQEAENRRAYVRRGELIGLVYAGLGFKGSSSNDFSNFVTQIMLEHGYRPCMLRGYRIYRGLERKV